MPIYEYSCTECGERVELFKRIDEEELTICPRCGGALRKVFSPVGIVLKGAGFYKTDSRAASKSKVASGEKPKADKPKTEATEKPKEKTA